MVISIKVYHDCTQDNMKVNNSHIMINISGKTFPEDSKNVGTYPTFSEHSDIVLQTLSVSWVAACSLWLYELQIISPPEHANLTDCFNIGLA